jgi:hypothetical protein
VSPGANGTGRAIAGVLAILLLATAAHAADATWELPSESAARLGALRAVLGDSRSTPADRDAARAEMMRMILANPDSPPPKKMPPRAAVTVPADALVKKPEVAKVVPVGPSVTRVAPPVPPSPPVTVPETGTVLQPQGAGYVDPATGRYFQAVPGGFIDPATGRFVPKIPGHDNNR